MKLVIQVGNISISKKIVEKDLDKVINRIIKKFNGEIKNPMRYELFRYKINKGVIVIYKDNKRLRTANRWFEYRALVALSELTGERYYYSVKKIMNGIETEVDGVSLDKDTMVEVKRARITQSWIDFYERKRKKLGFKNIIIIASNFERNTDWPPTFEAYRIKIDWKSLYNYYLKFNFPTWIREHIPKRHIRFLLPNGYWTGIKRKITDTAKYKMEDKFRKHINTLKSRGLLPVKVYYSLARMVNPVSEYHGKGIPLPYVILAFDVDVKLKEPLIIGGRKFFVDIIKKVRPFAKIIAEKIEKLGLESKIIYSGQKGFHIYGLKDNVAYEVRPEEIEELSKEFADLADNINFRSRSGFDLHRIFKLPGTVDASTGIVLSDKLKILSFNDKLEKIR